MCCKNELPKDLFEYIEPPENIEFQKYQAKIVLENNININNKDEIKNLQNLILFNIGGLSNYEVASIDKANNIGQFKFNIILGGNKIYNYTEYFNEIKEYLDGKNGIINEDEENPEVFYANNEYEIKNEEDEQKEKKKKKKKKRKNSSNDSYNINDLNNKSKDYIKIEMKNFDNVEEEKLDKSNDKMEKENSEDEKESSEEEKPKKKNKKKKKVEMEKIKNNDLNEPLKSDESYEDYK